MRCSFLLMQIGEHHYMALPGETKQYPGANVAHSIMDGGTFDDKPSKFAEAILQDCRSLGGGRMMVDVGAHLGYFTYIATSMGCRVAAIEPYTEHYFYHQWTQRINNIPTGRVAYHQKVCSDIVDQKMSFGGWSVAQDSEKNKAKQINMDAIRVDQVANEPVLLMKMDVEGYEAHGLRSAQNLFDNHIIEYIIIEITYRINFNPLPDIGTEIRKLVVDRGYHLILLEARREPVEILVQDFDKWWKMLTTDPEICDDTRAACQTDALLVHPNKKIPYLSKHQVTAWDGVLASTVRNKRSAIDTKQSK